MAAKEAKKEYQFEDFLAEVESDYQAFVSDVHKTLVDAGSKTKVESKASGMFISFSEPKTKRSLVNILFRKDKMLLRIYADNHEEYADFITILPEDMERQVAKSSKCKRFADPDACNTKCIKGYDFYIGDKQYQKCRYNCFQFIVDPESIPVLTAFVDHEIKARFAA